MVDVRGESTSASYRFSGRSRSGGSFSSLCGPSPGTYRNRAASACLGVTAWDLQQCLLPVTTGGAVKGDGRDMAKVRFVREASCYRRSTLVTRAFSVRSWISAGYFGLRLCSLLSDASDTILLVLAIICGVFISSCMTPARGAFGGCR